ncbi:hypothetical protein ABZ671_00850 [Micromonospora sp. NPDC006766]|uniref:hypothetical protein n=1 Tax=Micromonospora sp. NPDC006766 TaxID=3154778 RepID=UPI00340A86ED
MARTIVPVVDARKAGVAMAAEAAADVANGNFIPNDGKTLLIARNGNSGSTARTVSIVVTGAIDGFTAAPRTVSIPAGETWVLGPYEVVNYSGTLQLNGDHAELKFQAVRLP